MFDAAIIGTGPAGLSAAINLKLHDKSVVWFGSAQGSDKVEKSEKIANYPGMGLISGPELNAHYAAHAQTLGLTVEDKMVTNIMPAEDHFMLLAENEVYQARTVLLATGVVSARSFSGEAELLGRGVSYCATCDGFLHRGKTIAVFCAAARYEHEVEYLAGLAAKVYLYTPYKDSAVTAPNVEKIAPIRAVLGTERVTGVELFDGTQIEVEALFCLRNAVAPTSLLPSLTVEGAHIVVDRQQRTNLPGCFAAGDCTGRPYQLAKAVGEGNVAAHSMLEYLAEK
ncbi:MAG: FAD-dependent oxidoreductase [Oscillospiraceae bacterium]|nr:FAD-dependent oxidoreductase [Oscillospiraceae bacterium]